MPSPLPTATAVARRYLVVIAAMLLAASTLTLVAAAPARAAVKTDEDSGITYSFKPGATAAGATVTGYDVSKGADLAIPDAIKIGNDNYPVTAIGDYAFFQHKLMSVTLPKALTGIGVNAFAYNQLATVSLPNTLTTIDDQAFNGNLLTSVNLPKALTSIGVSAFAYNQLPSVALPDTLITIGNGAFDSNELTSVALPDALTTIGNGAFNANQLASVEIPPRVTSIGASAFRDNKDLTRVRFTGPMPAGVTGADHSGPTFTNSLGFVVEVPARYLARGGQPGFTTPMWRGYTTTTAPSVFFDSHGGSTIVPVTAWPGESVEPPSAPVRRGYTFIGWFTTPELAAPFDFADAIGEDVTVHAGWKATGVPAPGSLAGSSLDDFLPAGSAS